MKKNVFEMIHAMVNGQPVADMDTLRNEINTEWERLNAKADANRAAYNSAKDIVFSILTADKPMTAKEVFAAGGDRWPDGFTANKVQYGLRNYWADEVNKIENGKKAFLYQAK